MTWVDGAVLAVLAVSAIIAFFRGFVREVLGVGAWVGAVLAGFLAEPALHGTAERYVQPAWLASSLTVGVVALLVLIVLKLLIAWLANGIQRSMLGGVDRALGLLFGLARGAFLVVLAYILAGLFLPSVDRWPEEVRYARSLPTVAEGAVRLVALLPPDIRPRLPEGSGRRDPTLDQLLRPPARGRT
jgi:membrane protein required for colicin V production